MKPATLEPRPLYAIGTVARLTGLKPDTLRVWERRYGLGASHKSASGRRQYTQADLEHLQLVAALVGSGTRIGEIASAGRKTLEILLRRNGGPEALQIINRKPTVLFLGEKLCDWVEEHQGCLANVSAHLARVELAQAQERLAGEAIRPDLLVIGCGSLSFVQLQQVQALTEHLQAGRVLVSCEQLREHAVATLQQQGIATTAFPPDSGLLAYEATRCLAEQQGLEGEQRLRSLVDGKPREFSPEELAALDSVDNASSRALVALIRGLAEFERDMADAPVEDWSQASTRACAYAYAGQARYLMEKALQVVLSSDPALGESQAGDAAACSRRRRLHDAA